MTDDDFGASSKVAAMLAAERPIPAVDDALKRRIRERVAQSIALGGGPGGDANGGGGSADVGSGDANLLTQILGIKGIVATAFVLGAMVGGVGVGAIMSRREPSAIPPTPSAVTSVARVESAAPTPAPVPKPAETAKPNPAPSVAVARAASSAPSADSTHDRDLAAERALLSIARTAVGRRDPSAALSALRQHKQRFPKGRLSEERESLWIQALLLSGNATAAQERAKSFKADYPESMLGRGLDKALADAGTGVAPR
jgi:hypothetical protein